MDFVALPSEDFQGGYSYMSESEDAESRPDGDFAASISQSLYEYLDGSFQLSPSKLGPLYAATALEDYYAVNSGDQAVEKRPANSSPPAQPIDIKFETSASNHVAKVEGGTPGRAYPTSPAQGRPDDDDLAILFASLKDLDIWKGTKAISGQPPTKRDEPVSCIAAPLTTKGSFNFGIDAYLHGTQLGFGRQPSFRRVTPAGDVSTLKRSEHVLGSTTERDITATTTASGRINRGRPQALVAGRQPSAGTTTEKLAPRRTPAGGAANVVRTKAANGKGGAADSYKEWIDNFSSAPDTPSKERVRIATDDFKREVDFLMKGIMGLDGDINDLPSQWYWAPESSLPNVGEGAATTGVRGRGPLWTAQPKGTVPKRYTHPRSTALAKPSSADQSKAATSGTRSPPPGPPPGPRASTASPAPVLLQRRNQWDNAIIHEDENSYADRGENHPDNRTPATAAGRVKAAGSVSEYDTFFTEGWRKGEFEWVVGGDDSATASSVGKDSGLAPGARSKGTTTRIIPVVKSPHTTTNTHTPLQSEAPFVRARSPLGQLSLSMSSSMSLKKTVQSPPHPPSGVHNSTAPQASTSAPIERPHAKTGDAKESLLTMEYPSTEGLLECGMTAIAGPSSLFPQAAPLIVGKRTTTVATAAKASPTAIASGISAAQRTAIKSLDPAKAKMPAPQIVATSKPEGRSKSVVSVNTPRARRWDEEVANGEYWMPNSLSKSYVTNETDTKNSVLLQQQQQRAERDRATQRANEERKERVKTFMARRKAEKQRAEEKHRAELKRQKQLSEVKRATEARKRMSAGVAGSGDGAGVTKSSTNLRNARLPALPSKRSQMEPAAPYLVGPTTLRGSLNKGAVGSVSTAVIAKNANFIRSVVVYSSRDINERGSVDISVKDRTVLEVRHRHELPRFFNVDEYILFDATVAATGGSTASNQNAEGSTRRLSSLTLHDLRRKFLAGMNAAMLLAHTEHAQSAALAAFNEVLEGIFLHLPPSAELYLASALIQGESSADLLAQPPQLSSCSFEVSPLLGTTISGMTYTRVTRQAQLTSLVESSYQSSKGAGASAAVCSYVVFSVVLAQTKKDDVIVSSLLLTDVGTECKGYNQVLQKAEASPFQLFQNALGGPCFTVSVIAIGAADSGAVQMLNTQHKLSTIANKPSVLGSTLHFKEVLLKELSTHKQLSKAGKVDPRIERLKKLLDDAEQLLQTKSGAGVLVPVIHNVRSSLANQVSGSRYPDVKQSLDDMRASEPKTGAEYRRFYLSPEVQPVALSVQRASRSTNSHVSASQCSTPASQLAKAMPRRPLSQMDGSKSTFPNRKTPDTLPKVPGAFAAKVEGSGKGMKSTKIITPTKISSPIVRSTGLTSPVAKKSTSISPLFPSTTTPTTADPNPVAPTIPSVSTPQGSSSPHTASNGQKPPSVLSPKDSNAAVPAEAYLNRWQKGPVGATQPVAQFIHLDDDATTSSATPVIEKGGGMDKAKATPSEPRGQQLPGATSIGVNGPAWPTEPQAPNADGVTITMVSSLDDSFSSAEEPAAPAEAYEDASAIPASTKVRTLVIVDPLCSETSNVTYDNTMVIATTEDDLEEYDVDEVAEARSGATFIQSDVLKELCNTVLMGCNAAILSADSRSSSVSPLVLKSVVHSILAEIGADPKKTSGKSGQLVASIVQLKGETVTDLLVEQSEPQKLVIAISPIFGSCVHGVTYAPVGSSAAFGTIITTALTRTSRGKGRDFGLIFCSLILKLKSDDNEDVLVCSLVASLAGENVGLYNAVLDRNPLVPRALFHYALGGPCYTIALLGIGSEETRANQMLQAQKRLGEIQNRPTHPGSIVKFIRGIRNDLAPTLMVKLNTATDPIEQANTKEILERLAEMVRDAEALLKDFDNHDPKAYLHGNKDGGEQQQQQKKQQLQSRLSGKPTSLPAPVTHSVTRAQDRSHNEGALNKAQKRSRPSLPAITLTQANSPVAAAKRNSDSPGAPCPIRSLVCFDQRLMGGGSVVVEGGNTVLVRADGGGMRFESDEVITRSGTKHFLESRVIDDLVRWFVTGHCTGLLAADSSNCAFTPLILRKIAYHVLYAIIGETPVGSAVNHVVDGELRVSMCLIKDGITADLLPVEPDASYHQFAVEHHLLYGSHIHGVTTHLVLEPTDFDQFLAVAIDNAVPALQTADPGVMVVSMYLTQRVTGAMEDVLVSSLTCTAVFDATHHYTNVLAGDSGEPLDLFRNILSGASHTVAVVGISDEDERPDEMLHVLSEVSHVENRNPAPNSIAKHIRELQDGIFKLRERKTIASNVEERDYITTGVEVAERLLNEAEALMRYRVSHSPRDPFVPLGAEKTPLVTAGAGTPEGQL